MEVENEKFFQSIIKRKENEFIKWFDEKIKQPECIFSNSEKSIVFKINDLAIFQKNNQFEYNLCFLSKLIENKYGPCDMTCIKCELTIKVFKTKSIEKNETVTE